MGNFNMFPPEIILEILARLSTESILHCKLVCQQWRDLISHPTFLQMQLTHLNHPYSTDSSKLGFLFLYQNEGNPMYNHFFYFEYSENQDETPFNGIIRVNIHPPFMFYKIHNSCNGLIYLGVSHDNNYSMFDACICNPITKEYVVLPKLEERYTRNGRVMSGFDYIPLTNEYKVIRIYNEPEKPDVGLVEVYTLGSGNGWRNVGEFNHEIVLFARRHGTFVNGAIYWIKGYQTIVMFDLVHEIFRVVSLSTFPVKMLCRTFTSYSCKIGALGGYLMCATVDRKVGISEIWLLEEKNGNHDANGIWRKKLSVVHTLRPFALLKSGEVLYYNDTNLYVHNPTIPSLEMLVNMDEEISRPIPHMNTLVSLKALGEEDTQMM